MKNRTILFDWVAWLPFIYVTSEHFSAFSPQDSEHCSVRISSQSVIAGEPRELWIWKVTTSFWQSAIFPRLKWNLSCTTDFDSNISCAILTIFWKCKFNLFYRDKMPQKKTIATRYKLLLSNSSLQSCTHTHTHTHTSCRRPVVKGHMCKDIGAALPCLYQRVNNNMKQRKSKLWIILTRLYWRCTVDNVIPKKSLETISLRRQGDTTNYIPKFQVAKMSLEVD